MSKLFEITMLAYKTFYVEADSQEEALEKDVVEDEAMFNFGKASWEHELTKAKELTPYEEMLTRKMRPKLIFKDE